MENLFSPNPVGRPDTQANEFPEIWLRTQNKNSIKRYWRLVIENSESAQVVPDVHQVEYCRSPVLDLYIASYP